MWWHAPSRGAGCGLPCTSAGHPSRGTATLAATRAPHLGQRPRVFQTKVGMSGASAPGVAVGMRTVRAMAMLGEGGDPFVTLLRQQRAMERSLLDNMEQGPPLTASGSQRDTSTTLSRQLGDSGFAYTERGGTEGASDGGYYKSYYSYTVYSSQPPVMVAQQQSAAAVAGWFVPVLVLCAWLAGAVRFLRGFALTRYKDRARWQLALSWPFLFLFSPSFREEFRKAFQAQDVGGTSGTSGGGGGTQSDDVDAATTKSGQ